MRYEFIDLSFRFSVSNDKELLGLLDALGVVGVVQEGIEKYFRLNSLMVFPRISLKRTGKPSSAKGNKLAILKVNTQEEIKATNTVKRNAVAIEVSGRALSKLSRKALGKLETLSLPVIVRAKDIYSALLRSEALAGLEALLNEFIKGYIMIAVASGAEKVNELRHPITYAGLMIELGVPEALALQAVFNQPKMIVRRAGYSV